MKQKIHTLTITVRFDKPCTAQHALREVRDTIHGEFYPTQRQDDEPGAYRVRRISKLSQVTEEQIERRVEKLIDHLDACLLNGSMTVKNYAKAMADLTRWAELKLKEKAS